MGGLANWVKEFRDDPWSVLTGELSWILLAVGGFYALLYLVDVILRPEQTAGQEGKEAMSRPRELL